MPFNFTLKIDDDKHSLSAEDGISIERLSQLLDKLYKAIDINMKAKCTLSKIRGNCYALDFTSESERHLNNFITVHKNIEQLPTNTLDPDQRKYAETLKLILGNRFYLKAYDDQNTLIASIKINEIKEPLVYFTQSTVYGILSELGSKSLNSKAKHIYLDGYNERIQISSNQDLELKDYYGTKKLRVKIRQKRSAIDGHVISTEMTGFEVVGEGNFSDNLANAGYIDFNLIQNIHTMEGIINKLYGG